MPPSRPPSIAAEALAVEVRQVHMVLAVAAASAERDSYLSMPETPGLLAAFETWLAT